MNAHRVEAVINEDGTLTLMNLPFQAGDVVEVIIFERSLKPKTGSSYPLHGTPIQYDAPTEPLEEYDDHHAG